MVNDQWMGRWIDGGGRDVVIGGINAWGEGEIKDEEWMDKWMGE